MDHSTKLQNLKSNSMLDIFTKDPKSPTLTKVDCGRVDSNLLSGHVVTMLTQKTRTRSSP